MADYDEIFNVDVPDVPTLTRSEAQLSIESFIKTVPFPSYVLLAEELDPESNPIVLYYDGSYTDYSTEAAEDTPDDVELAEVGAYLYIGGASTFYVIEFNVTTPLTGTAEFNIKYYNGSSWDLVDYAGNVEFDKFGTAELIRIAWHIDSLSDWAQTSVDGTSAYWISINVTGGTVTQQPLAGRIKLLSTSIAHVANLSDTITLTDSLALGAGINVADAIALGDDLDLGAGSVLADTINLADEIQTNAQREIADSITLNDALALDVALSLSDSIALNDAIVAGNQMLLNDTINLSDAIILDAAIILDDVITLTDEIGQDFLLPGDSEWEAGPTIKTNRQPKSWVKPTSGRPSPISAITRSSENTTFTMKTIVDGSAWDLSNVENGYLVMTSSGFVAAIESVGVNSLNINTWYYAGSPVMMGATNLPAAGDTVTVHCRLQAKRVLIEAKDGNTDNIYLGVYDPGCDDTTGHPIAYDTTQPNSRVELRAPRDRWLNLSQLWVASGQAQNAIITVDGAIQEEGE